MIRSFPAALCAAPAGRHACVSPETLPRVCKVNKCRENDGRQWSWVNIFYQPRGFEHSEQRQVSATHFCGFLLLQDPRTFSMYLKVQWQCATLFCIYFSFFIQQLHSYIIHAKTFAEAHLHIFTAVGTVGGTSMGCRAEIRTRACLTASQPTIYYYFGGFIEQLKYDYFVQDCSACRQLRYRRINEKIGSGNYNNAFR